MGYQALLFCPDEKTARPVTQVLKELDFNVTSCTEPFAAVKKLMAEHFDAVVVDCDNEQNATLLFKSARNTAHNQSALAVAVVEGQAGVAKAFRIGANLVLTKPINVEQAKGTLRVARGLLRKSEGTKPAPGTSTSKPAATGAAPPQEAAISHVEVTPPALSQPPLAAAAPRASIEKSDGGRTGSSVDLIKTSREHDERIPEEISSLRPAEFAARDPLPETTSVSAEAKVATAPSRTGLGMSAGSAPAPARESKVGVSTESKPSTNKESAPISKVSEPNNASSNEAVVPAPTFTFGGTMSTDAQPASGGSKKIVAAVAIVLIVAGGHAAWMHWGRANDRSPVQDQVVESPAKTFAAAPAASPAPTSTLVAPTTSSTEKAPTHPSKGVSASNTSKPSPSAAITSKPPATEAATEATQEDAEPIVIKSNAHKPGAKVASVDAPALSMTAVAPGGDGGGLPNLLDSPSNAPTPVLQALNVSQGVSQGLLLKQVQPRYPANSLRLRVEGSVELLATISKSGNISAVKILTGDKELAHAAADAVKQWKYKPYLLNGSPVEIQTQVTVNFKLPK
jgi:periplasmic protein TonB